MRFSKPSLALLQAVSTYAATQKVNVGGNQQLTFSPQTVNAQPGDTVQFVFLDQNHTATAGKPNAGCQPSGDFNSGFVPIPANGQGGGAAKKGKKGGKQQKLRRGWDLEARQNGGKPTFSVQVQDTNPITVYCAQAQHCQQGMVMVINPTDNGATSLAAYKRVTAKAKNNVAPNGVNGGQLQGLNQQAAQGQAAGGTAKKGKKAKAAGGKAAGKAAGGKAAGGKAAGGKAAGGKAAGGKAAGGKAAGGKKGGKGKAAKKAAN